MNHFIAGWNTFSEAWISALWRASWQGAIALTLVWGLVRLWPRMPAQLRPWLWRLAGLKLLLALCWTPFISLPVLPASPEPPLQASQRMPIAPLARIDSSIAGQNRALVLTRTPQADVKQRVSSMMPTEAGPVALQPAGMLFIIWLCALGVLILRVSVQALRRRDMLHASRLCDDRALIEQLEEMSLRFQLHRPPELRIAEISQPLITGLLQPTILLPIPIAAAGDPVQLRVIFAHELMHVQRRDLFWGWLSLLVRSLFFYHPLVLLTYREWSLAQEIACDAAAVRFANMDRADYAQVLVRLASQRPLNAIHDAQTLGVLNTYRTLERRLVMLKNTGRATAKQIGLAGMLLAVTTVLCLTPWTVTAQDVAPRDTGDLLVQQWEDVLLLDAVDYLHLSSSQWQEMLTLAKQADSRASAARKRQENARERLGRLVERQRKALLQGRRPTVSEQEEALALDREIRQRQEPEIEDIVNFAAPRFARLLTRKQVKRAWFLMFGETPQGESRRSALLDPSSGFVLDESTQFHWKQDQVEYELLRVYPDQVIEAAHRGNRSMRAMMGFFSPGKAEEPDQNVLELSDSFSEEVRQTEDQIRDRISDESGQYLDRADANELTVVLRPLARRMFLSPRLKQVLEERNQSK